MISTLPKASPPNGLATMSSIAPAPTGLSTSFNGSSSSSSAQPRIKTSNPQSIAPAVNAQVPLSARRAEALDMTTVERRGKPLPGWREPVTRNHINGIPEAPTYRPTDEEWRDPMEYMRKIAPEGSKYGIVKIIPPDSWNPDFAIDTERFHFRTRKQELNSVEGSTRVNLDYLDQLTKFHKSQGMNLNRFPSVDKRPLDLYELKKAVESRGGFERVCKGKKWAEIGRILGYSGKIMSSLSTSLKNSYAKWLEPYERYLAGAKPAVQWQMEQERGGPYGTPSPGPSPIRKSHQHTPSGLSHTSPARMATEALNNSFQPREIPSPSQFRSDPSIPRAAGFTAVNSGGFTAVNTQPQPAAPLHHSLVFNSMSGVNGIKPQLDPMAGEHNPATGFGSFQTTSRNVPNGYAPHDLKRSLSETMEIPGFLDDEKFERQTKRVKKEGAPTVTGSHMTQPRAQTPSRQGTADKNNWKPGDYCENCGEGEDDKNILLCDSCYHGYHRYCLDPPLQSIPDYDWHCPKCLVGTGEFGFEEGGTYSLRGFQERAFYMRESHFAKRQPFDPILNGPKPVTEDDVEREFWRLVSSLTETVEVEYGADIHSTTHGSGFPTVERHPRDPYSTNPWNLNILPLHHESLFRYIKSDISGMTVPWLYVGMIFSTFCWHNEDHYTYSANYQHFGNTKTWYGIPGADAERFENTMKEVVPDLFEKQPDLLFQLVTLLTPELLRKAGVNVYAADQRAGQFIITFPQAYHAGFNHGFNFNEAVNFAPADWEPFGQAGVERLQEFRRQPCFSHDELLLTAAGSKDLPIKTTKWLAPALQKMCDREVANRQKFEEYVEDGKLLKFRLDEDITTVLDRKTDTEDLSEEQYVCHHCKAYSFLSRFVCTHTGQVACLDHIWSIDCCTRTEGHVIHVRMTTTRLEQVVAKIVEKARAPEAWAEKYESTVLESAKPQLKTLRSLLSEGERIPWEISQLSELKQFVDRCNEWVEEANNYITRKQQNRRKNEKAWRKGITSKVAEMEERDREMRKLENVKKLLDEAEHIGFDCPEITTLQERADAIAAFQQDARDALSDLGNRSTQQIEDLTDVGRSFSVEIPEVDQLEKIIRQMKWKDRSSDRAQHKTLQEVDELIDEADELSVPRGNELLLHLQDSKQRGEMWEAKAKELMSADTIQFAQLDSFSKQAADLPVSRQTIASIDAVLKKQRDAQDQIANLYNQTKEIDVRKRPLYKDLIEVMKNVSELNSKPAGTLDLEREQKRHEDWMRRGKKLFGKTNAPLHILHQHLKIVDNRNKSCLDLTDKPRMPVEPSSREHTPEPSQEGQEGQSMSNRDIFCLCRLSEDGMMIECHVCHEWYHSKCLKIARGKVKDDDDFVCPICDHRVKVPRDAARPKLEEIIALHEEISNLPFQPDEEETIKSIIDVGQAFRNQMQQFINPNPVMATQDEVPIMRFYLRKIEGADIFLVDETNFFRQELYRFIPIAPEPPPIIESSSSTRKPRPTKQQKLMARHGVTDPEDLPQHLRTKSFTAGRRKTNDDLFGNGSKQGGTVSGSHSRKTSFNGSNSHTPVNLNFKQPLTANAFPRRHSSQSARTENGESPQLSLQRPPSQYGSPYGGPTSAGLPTLGSPFGSAPGISPSTHDTNLDPTLFENDGPLSHNNHARNISRDSNGQDHHYPGRDGDARSFYSNTDGDFDNDHDGSFRDAEHEDSQADANGQDGDPAYENMLADLTNQDDQSESQDQISAQSIAAAAVKQARSAENIVDPSLT